MIEMTEENTINEEMLAIIKALTSKIEALESAVYHKDNLLMKSGFVVSSSPTPLIDNMAAVSGPDVSSMAWSDIHKMVEKAGSN